MNLCQISPERVWTWQLGIKIRVLQVKGEFDHRAWVCLNCTLSAVQRFKHGNIKALTITKGRGTESYPKDGTFFFFSFKAFHYFLNVTQALELGNAPYFKLTLGFQSDWLLSLLFNWLGHDAMLFWWHFFFFCACKILWLWSTNLSFCKNYR